MTLPPGWEETPLGDLCLPVEKVRPDEQADREFTYIDISSIDRAVKTIVSPQRLVGREAPTRARQLVRASDILFSTVRPNLRTIARVPGNLDGEVASTGFCVLRPSPELNADFVFWAVLADDFQSRVIAKARGVSYPAVRDPDVLEETIPVPPRAEQDRIVAAIKRAFEAIERGLADLQLARGSAGRFATSVVEEAVPAAALSDGQLPSGWQLRTPVELAKNERHALAIGPFGSNLKVSDYRSSGVPLIFVRNIRSGEFGGLETRYIDAAKANELSAHQVEAGDLLITKMGDPPGDCAIYPAGRPEAVITADCVRFAVDPEKADPRFIALLFRTRFVRAQVDVRTKGVAQRKISLRTFRTIQLPVPESGSRQRELAARIEAQLNERERLDRAFTEADARADGLRRAVLGAALSGNLAAQDASEPATNPLDDAVPAL